MFEAPVPNAGAGAHRGVRDMSTPKRRGSPGALTGLHAAAFSQQCSTNEQQFRLFFFFLKRGMENKIN